MPPYFSLTEVQSTGVTGKFSANGKSFAQAPARRSLTPGKARHRMLSRRLKTPQSAHTSYTGGADGSSDKSTHGTARRSTAHMVLSIIQ